MLNLARRGAVTVAILLVAMIASAVAPLVANVIAPMALDSRATAVPGEATPIFETAAIVDDERAAQSSRTELRDAMRKLWSDHVLWTRQYVVSVVAGLPDKDAVTQRLLQNQTDIGAAMARFYGTESGGKLTGLLKAHIVTAGELVAAAKSGNAAKTDSVDAKWRANADEIADFLHHANEKNWSVATVRTALYTHLTQTRAEVEHRLKKDYIADIQDFEAISQHILTMADMLTDGIVAQFPAKFGAAKTGS
jgi:hypothetical protein